MNNSHCKCALCALLFLLNMHMLPAHADGVSGQGTWETTLQGRDLDGNAATFEAFYDTVLDITWLANANASGTAMLWHDATSWTAGLNVNGVTGWRLPVVIPVNGSTIDTTFSNNATTDLGFAPTTTDGTDGGWRDSAGQPLSEFGHLYYVTLGNLGYCTPNDASPDSCVIQPGAGLSNTGPFSNIRLSSYWTGAFITNSALNFFFDDSDAGLQLESLLSSGNYVWAVHDGDVSEIPTPGAIWLFSSGLLCLAKVSRRKLLS